VEAANMDPAEAQKKIVDELVQDAMNTIRRRVSNGGDKDPFPERLPASRLGELADATLTP